MAASEAVTMAIKIDIITRPVMIHKMQNTRPRVDLGERSPYLWRKIAFIILCQAKRVAKSLMLPTQPLSW